MKSGVVEQAELAKTLDAIGQHREALAIYRQALSRSPIKAPICVLMSTSALSHGDREQAERFLMFGPDQERYLRLAFANVDAELMPEMAERFLESQVAGRL